MLKYYQDQVDRAMEKFGMSAKAKKGRSGKYNAKRTKNEDGTFSDSKREAKFDSQIMAMRSAPDVKAVVRKVVYQLVSNSVLVGVYESDWSVYYKSGRIEVYDAKGCMTKEYTKKKRLMKAILGISIKEL